MNNEEIYNSEIKELLNRRLDNLKEFTVTVNDGKPIFSKKDFEIIEGEPQYFEPDEYGRSNGAMAFISKNTIPLVIKKKLKYPEPYGWTKNLENKNVFERCHLIAYSLSAQLADKRNIFIGTETLNTSIMYKIEKRVKDYAKDNDVKILYRVTVKYKGKNQIPTGILIEAQSIEDDFIICEFCYNIQKNAKFDYSDGTIIKYNKIITKAKNTIKKIFGIKKENKKETQNNLNYVINRNTNEFHLKDTDCNNFKNVQSKYINETTATEKDLLKVGLKPCKKCIEKKK